MPWHTLNSFFSDPFQPTAAAHWRASEGYIYESTNRPFDGAVIHSIATFGEFLFPPESEEAAATVAFLSKKFCREYPINQADNEAGKPGNCFSPEPKLWCVSVSLDQCLNKPGLGLNRKQNGWKWTVNIEQKNLSGKI